jgi:hypothetical protein
MMREPEFPNRKFRLNQLHLHEPGHTSGVYRTSWESKYSSIYDPCIG